MDYTVILEKADDQGFNAYVPDLPGCVSCGDSLEEALKNIEEAIVGHLQVLREHGEPVPSPRSTACVVHAS